MRIDSQVDSQPGGQKGSPVDIGGMTKGGLRIWWTLTDGLGHALIRLKIRYLNPNPPKDTDGRREDSGRGWVRELQGRWPGVLG